MGVKKGQVLNPHGRPKGSKNEKTKQWEKFSKFMMTTGLDRFEMEMQALEAKDFVDTMIKMMEYFQPKLARTELTGKDGEKLFPKPILDGLAKVDPQD